MDTLRVLGVSVSIILPGLGMASGGVSSTATLTRGRAKGLDELACSIVCVDGAARLALPVSLQVHLVPDPTVEESWHMPATPLARYLQLPAETLLMLRAQLS